MRRYFLISSVFLALLLCFRIMPAISAEQHVYLVSVLPQMSASDLDRNWGPFIERLSADLGVKFRLKYYTNMTDFEEALQAGIPDFAYMTPPQAVIARHAKGYIPLVRSSREISGVVVVRKESPINSIADLAGKEVAYVGTHNVCSLLVRDALGKEGPAQMKQLFAGNTANMYKHVLLGKADAGATLDVELGQQPVEVAAQLRMIYQTKKTPPHPFSAHPRVPQFVRAALIKAVLAMNRNSETIPLLKAVRLADPVEADYARDYKKLDSIDLRRLTKIKD